MQRRKFIAAIGSVAAGAAAVTGTGAFTSVSADRAVSISVTEDSSSYLSFSQSDTGPNSQYAEVGSNQIVIDLNNSDDGGGSGLNKDAKTDIFDIFKIENQGTQPVFTYVDPDSVTQNISGDPDDDDDNEFGDEDGVYIDPQFSDRPNAVNFTDGRGAISATGIYGTFDPTTGFSGTNTYDAKDVTLGVGQSLDFGLFVDTTGVNGEFNLDASMNIVADADLAGDLTSG